MASAAAEDPLFESLQLLPPKIESFRKSLSQICENNKNADAVVLRRELEDYYRDRHNIVRSMYEELNRKEKSLETGAKESAVVGQDASENADVSRVNAPAFAEVEVRQEIRSLCDNMDGSGLRNYIVNHRKDIDALRDELPSALYKALDSAKLVLKALEGYDFSESTSSRTDKKESAASVNRRACILLLECLFPVLRTDPSKISTDAKNKAKEMGKFWIQRMGIVGNESSCNSLDAQAFLQLLATFGIASEYDEDQLCNLVLAIARRKQTPSLCKSLGLAARVSEIVDKLCKSDKQIEALAFAHAFDMMDKVEPVSLLKAYLNNAQEAAQAFLKRGHGSPASQNDSTMKEVSALKAVIRTVEEYNLHNVYPTDSLQKRIAELEKAKAGRKKSAAPNRGPHKRHRTPGSGDDIKGIAETEVLPTEDRSLLPRTKYDSVARLGGAVGAVGAVGLSRYNFDVTQSNPERKSPERYTSAYLGGNRGLIGSSVYGSGATSVAFATPLPNAAQSSYERRGPESFTSSFGGGQRSPIRGVAAGSFTTVLSNGPPSKYERRGPESYTSAFGGGNISPVRSSVYGSSSGAGVSTTPFSSVAQSNYERRGSEPYTSALGGHRGPVGSSLYGSGTPLPSFNVAQSNYESRGSERNTQAFDGANRSSMSSSVYTSGGAAGAFTTSSSSFRGYQFGSGLPSSSSAHGASFLH